MMGERDDINNKLKNITGEDRKIQKMKFIKLRNKVNCQYLKKTTK